MTEETEPANPKQKPYPTFLEGLALLGGAVFGGFLGTGLAAIYGNRFAGKGDLAGLGAIPHILIALIFLVPLGAFASAYLVFRMQRSVRRTEK